MKVELIYRPIPVGIGQIINNIKNGKLAKNCWRHAERLRVSFKHILQFDFDMSSCFKHK